MIYYLPTKVISEENCVRKYSDLWCAYGSKAMIITGSSSSRINGSLMDVTNELSEKNIQYIVFDDIEENPSVETVMLAASIGIKENVDFVIGIGGGSPLDAAKAIALMIANEDETKELLYDPISVSHLPVIAIPTTAGTGSEVTPYSILTSHELKTKKSISHKIFPEVALVDYRYLATASNSVMINTAVDALSHLVESFLNKNSNEYNQIFSFMGMNTWARTKEFLLYLKETKCIDEDELKKRDINLINNLEDLMYSSTLAGMAIAHTGTSLPHALSYALTYLKEMPHGKAVARFLPNYLYLYEKKDKKMADQVIRYLGFKDIDEFRDFIYKLIGKVEINEDIIEKNYNDVLYNQSKLANFPYSVEKEDILNMMKN